jgi:hypothetical protein
MTLKGSSKTEMRRTQSLMKSKKKLNDNEERQFVLFAGNALIDLTRMIFAKTNQTVSELRRRIDS